MRIREVHCKTALSPSSLPGIDYSLNPYRGCEHACIYCYVPSVLSIPRDEWGEFIDIRRNIPTVLAKELKKKKCGTIGISTVTDPYQPIEKKYRLTRLCLEQLTRYDFPIDIQTKSDLVLRDTDLFKEFKDIEVGITVNGFDGKLKEEIEPLSPSNERRINALKVLHENGIKNYAFISPIIPNLVDVEQLIKETRDFVNFYWFEFLNLKASGKEFREWLKRNYPESYDLISDKTKAEKYVKEVVNAIKKSEIFVKGICVHYPIMVVK